MCFAGLLLAIQSSQFFARMFPSWKSAESDPVFLSQWSRLTHSPSLWVCLQWARQGSHQRMAYRRWCRNRPEVGCCVMTHLAMSQCTWCEQQTEKTCGHCIAEVALQRARCVQTPPSFSLSLSLSLSLSHTHAHTQTHARTHACTHTQRHRDTDTEREREKSTTSVSNDKYVKLVFAKHMHSGVLQLLLVAWKRNAKGAVFRVPNSTWISKVVVFFFLTRPFLWQCYCIHAYALWLIEYQMINICTDERQAATVCTLNSRRRMHFIHVDLHISWVLHTFCDSLNFWASVFLLRMSEFQASSSVVKPVALLPGKSLENVSAQFQN